MLRKTMGRFAPLLLLLLLMAAGAAFAADWPQFRGPDRDGSSNESGLLESWPEAGPPELWRVGLGAGYSAISVVGRKLYTMFGQGDEELVACFSATDGTELWRRKVGPLWKDRFGDGPRSTPTVSGGVVYALGAHGTLVALDAADGSPRWKRDLKADYGAKPPTWGVSTSPLLVEGRLIVDVGGSGDRSLVAFDPETGKELWSSQADQAGYSAPIVVTIGDVTQVVALTGNAMVSVSPADGTMYWRVPWKTSYGVNASTPVFIAPDKLFVSTGYDVGAALYRISIEEGKPRLEQLWKNREMRNKFSSSVLVGRHLYGFDEKMLKCIDVASGEMCWRARDFGHGSLIYADGRLIVLGDEGVLALVEADPGSYKEVGRIRPFQGKTWTMPTLADGKLFLRDEKQLVAFDLSIPQGESPAR